MVFAAESFNCGVLTAELFAANPESDLLGNKRWRLHSPHPVAPAGAHRARPVGRRGPHRFAFAPLPHGVAPTSGGVIAEAPAFNTPMRLVAAETAGEGGAGGASTLPARQALVTIDDAGVVVVAINAANDGDGTIMRFHESCGGRRRVVLRVVGASSAERTDLFEAPAPGAPIAVHDGAVELELRPFELVALRMR